MTFKTLIKAIVVAGTLAFAGVASAATPQFSSFDSNGVAIFSNVFTSATPFTDDFAFEIAAGNNGNATATAIAGFTNFSFNAVFTSAFIYNAADLSKTPLAINVSPFPFTAILQTPTLSAGHYVLELAGIAQAGGSYAGQLKLVTAPVPEPETYAMFLAGLGLMGAIARRRKNA